MTKGNVLKMEDIPQVDIRFMNNTHSEEVQMVQELGEMVLSAQESDELVDSLSEQITTKLEQWIEHTQAHFSRENTLMQQIDFPAFAIHSDEHVSALTKLTTVLDQWSCTQDINAVAEYVFNTWPAWFNLHLNTMDRITASFAVMNGFDPEGTV